MQNNYPKRGEVYWVQLDPSIGKEIKKARPCVVVSNDLINRHQDLIIVIPLTSNVSRIQHRLETETKIQNTPGKAVILHTRSVDKANRLGKKVGELTKEEMNLLDACLKNTLGL